MQGDDAGERSATTSRSRRETHGLAAAAAHGHPFARPEPWR